jgi:SNF2 family DNA or RNA helicase
LLGERQEFSRAFTKPIKEDSRNPAAAKLKRIIEPFILRRMKTDESIASELGDKKEIREYCPLTPLQRRLYEDALISFKSDNLADPDARNRQGRMLALLTKLKEICDTPELVQGDLAATLSSGKIARLMDLLESVFEAGESALIFTQYAKMGRILRDHLKNSFGRRIPFLHGSLTPNARENEIKAFNDSVDPTAFILSLKAGGFGLNLTKATHVIHFDRWWNPAVENQATDRAHRIGQTKTVFVHTFISPGTLEDHIDALLESKRLLANEIVTSGESFLLRMSDGEFERMVRLDG